MIDNGPFSDNLSLKTTFTFFESVKYAITSASLLPSTYESCGCYSFDPQTLLKKNLVATNPKELIIANNFFIFPHIRHKFFLFYILFQIKSSRKFSKTFYFNSLVF
ncbi:hypothetical protein [Spiroplasma helicoides]|uniref:hypothetical protein n=1 Tax=Spiroplasma helicoides TaxID=216938 RepID=UPI00083F930D|nr:hypothetical protein [Spiroplasma helicoides]